MKTGTTHRSCHAALAAAIAFSTFAVAGDTPPVAATPYTFVGRLMDSSHAGFDSTRVCTISAYDEDGRLLKTDKTFFYENSRNNYSLHIPYSTSPAAGYAVKGDRLVITVKDDSGKTWNGVIDDPFCGPAGGVREVDIVLCEDGDGDGIDDALFKRLRDEWAASGFAKSAGAFDPSEDHDGDGMATIDEAFAGTDPFDAEDVLRITAFSLATGPEDGAGEIAPGQSQAVISFPTISGRAYSVSSVTNLSSGTWSSSGFYPSQAAGEPARCLSVPSGSRSRPVTRTLYLLPTENASGFFRVNLE